MRQGGWRGAVIGAGLVALTLAAPALAQENEQQQQSWRSHCSGPERDVAKLNCRLELSVIVEESRQLLIKLTISVPAVPRTPSMMVQTPLGLKLSEGVRLTVDDNEPHSHPVQTCEANGCYAGFKLNSDLSTEMAQGNKLVVAFNNLNGRTVDVTVPLSGFSDAMARIR